MTDDFSSLMTTLFAPNQQCIINADLDGILSGMILQKYLGWRIVGFSSCSGSPSDELWVMSPGVNLVKCVFVDLPVALKSVHTIDQHFVSYDSDSVNRYNCCGNKLNPNSMRGRCYINGDYCRKYPFGTVHFIIACLEHLGIINGNIIKNKTNGAYDSLDLLLRADGVIKNTYTYTPNCFDWCNWMMQLGGETTSHIFSVAKNEYIERYNRIGSVEKDLSSLGCCRKDGDCSNLVRKNDIERLQTYMHFLSQWFGMPEINVSKCSSVNLLTGKRLPISPHTPLETREKTVFSYAFVNANEVSITYRNNT